MSRLDKLIQELCPDGVEYKRIGVVCEVLTGGEASDDSIKSKEPIGDYIYPIYSNGIGENALWGYSKTYRVDRDCVTFSSIGTIGYPTIRKAKFTPIIRLKSIYPLDEKQLCLSFLKYALEIVEFEQQKSSVPNINANMIKNIVIPVPPLPVQQEIVRILDNFTELQAELAAELAARKKQYECYREELLSFKDAPYKALEEICDYVDYRGKTPRKTDDGVFLVTAKNIRQGYIDYEKSQEFISIEDYYEVMRRGLPIIGDVLITTEAPCGNVAQVDREDIALAQRVIKYRPKSAALDSTFLKYVLLGNEFQSKLQANATGGTVKGIKGSKLHKLTIPVPSIECQKKIAYIMQNFENLTGSIISGLPAEISARQKQYEYYRDKLLNFKELM